MGRQRVRARVGHVCPGRHSRVDGKWVCAGVRTRGTTGNGGRGVVAHRERVSTFVFESPRESRRRPYLNCREVVEGRPPVNPPTGPEPFCRGSTCKVCVWKLVNDLLEAT